MRKNLVSKEGSQTEPRGVRGTRAWRKLRESAGETLIETLIAFLVIMLALSALAMAVVSSARVNAAIDPEETIFNFTDAEEVEATVAISHASTGAVTVSNVTGYRTTEEKGEYLYYIYDESATSGQTP